MIEITPLDWFHISGRGDVVTFTNPEAATRDEVIARYISKRISVEGNEYTVAGVETFGIQSQRKGIGLGLLIKEPRIKPSGPTCTMCQDKGITTERVYDMEGVLVSSSYIACPSCKPSGPTGET